MKNVEDLRAYFEKVFFQKSSRFEFLEINDAHSLVKLRPKEEDLRPENKKRYKSGKRRSFEGRTGCLDPFDAGKQAIKWYREVRNQMIEDAKLLDFDTGKSLEHYFEIWFDSFKSDYINQRGGQKRITNVKGYWSGKEIGICHQPFAQKNIEEAPAAIIYSLEGVFAVIAAWLILNQILQIENIIGCFLILLAVIFSQIAPMLKKNQL